MAYFDSAKNRAKWQEELNRLTEERDRRAQSGYAPGAEIESASQLRPRVEKITFAQLEAEEYAARNPGLAAAGKDKSRERSQEMKKEPVKAAPQMQGKSL